MREGLSLLKFVQVTCKFATSDKTAHAGVDYEQTEGELVFADSETKKEIKINIFDDEACALLWTRPHGSFDELRLLLA